MRSARTFTLLQALLLFTGVSSQAPLRGSLLSSKGSTRGLGDKCPVIETVADFSLERYIEKSWFVQRQQVNLYQKAESLVCVVATYEDNGKKNYGRPAISIYNADNQTAGGGDKGFLCATRKNSEKDPAKLSVVPCGVPNVLAGPYWVAAVGSNYEWAIIIGGQPDKKGECGQVANLCTTGEGYIGGLWFFTRERVANQTTLDIMETTAEDLGICTANMLDVVQAGCTYDGVRLKE